MVYLSPGICTIYSPSGEHFIPVADVLVIVPFSSATAPAGPKNERSRLASAIGNRPELQPSLERATAVSYRRDQQCPVCRESHLMDRVVMSELVGHVFTTHCAGQGTIAYQQSDPKTNGSSEISPKPATCSVLAKSVPIRATCSITVVRSQESANQKANKYQILRDAGCGVSFARFIDMIEFVVGTKKAVLLGADNETTLDDSRSSDRWARVLFGPRRSTRRLGPDSQP